MSQESTASYDQWHATLDVDTDGSDPWFLLVKQHLDPARDLAGRQVLEIGCGRGGFSCWLATASNPRPHVVATDFSPVAVEMGRAHGERLGLMNVSWRTGDIQAINHPDATFETAISCETIEHVPDPRQAVKELARVLKPGGRLFLTTPNYFGAFGLYRAYLRLRGRRFTEVGQPINQLTLLPLTLKWIRQAGLVVETISGEGHYLFVPGRQPRRIRWLDRELLKWIALHVLIVARKPLPSAS